MSAKAVRIVLGLLWILNGLLQLQPKMFTGDFANQLIRPLANGQPAFVSDPIHLAVSIFLINPAVFNSFIVLVQLSIGSLILFKKTKQTGLVLSIIWGLLVWSIGEAYGGIFTGHFDLLMGAPGAALLYVILALSIYTKEDSELPSYLLVFVWSAIWVLGGVSFALNFHSTNAVGLMLESGLVNAPYWLSSITKHAGWFLGSLKTAAGTIHHQYMVMSNNLNQDTSATYWSILFMALIEILIGFSPAMRRKARQFMTVIGCILLSVFWIIGQNAGGYYSGLMTDLNAAPILIFIGIILLSNDYSQQLANFNQVIKNKVI